MTVSFNSLKMFIRVRVGSVLAFFDLLQKRKYQHYSFQSELMNSIRNQEYFCNGSRLPLPLCTALTEVKKTAELLQAEVEESAEFLHPDLQVPADTVLNHLVLQNLLYHLLNCIRQVMDVDTVAVLLQTDDEQQLAVRATLGLEEEIIEDIRIPLGHGFAGRIATSCNLTIVDDLSKVEVVSPILRNKQLKSMLGVPLLVKDRVIGVFHVGTVHPRQFTRDDTQLLQLVAEHIGLAIDCLAISRASITKTEPLVREKFALTCVLQKLRRTTRNLQFYPLSRGFLESVPPLRLVSTFC